MRLRPSRSTRTDTLFPYTTLFRSLYREMTEKLTRMAAGEEGLHQLEADLAAKAGAYRAAAEKLTGQRREAACRLDHAVATELAPLKLDAARFRTLVEPLDESQWTARGADRVEFEISTNPGAPVAPLIKIASGGELKSEEQTSDLQ